MKLFTTTLTALTLMAMASTASAYGYGSGSDADSEASSNQDQGQGQALVDNSQSTVHGSDLSNMVPAVTAPSLSTTLTETCMGSTSGGVSWAGAGISFGTTWRDSACVRRLDARQVSALHPNFVIAAKEIMCDSDQVFNAFKRAGLPCADRNGEVAVAEPKK